MFHISYYTYRAAFRYGAGTKDDAAGWIGQLGSDADDEAIVKRPKGVRANRDGEKNKGDGIDEPRALTTIRTTNVGRRRVR